MTKEELLERINDIRDGLEELADDAESIDVEEKIVRNTAFKMPFADVKQMLAAGMVDLFHIGDQVVNQHELFGAVVWDIIGINADMPASGEDVPTLTLLMHDVIDGRFVYDKESEGFPYGHAHYPSSTIRSVLNTDILNGFSEADRAAMLEVEKTTYTVDSEGSKPETTADKLFLLSCTEVGFPAGDYVRFEGAAYPFFTDDESREKRDVTGSPRYWWLRSPYPGSASNARVVGTTGARGNLNAYNGHGAAAACANIRRCPMTQQHPSNLRLSPEVGIRSLKDLTKDELIYCINNACTDEYRLNWALISVADKRQEAKWRKEDEAMAQHSKLSKELMALVSPYEGMPLSKVPHDVVLKADALARRMQRLEKSFFPK